MSEDYSKFDIEMSRRALVLASKGAGQVSPSPLVGCVVVSKERDVVGEGTYLFENVTHAEVVALEQAGKRAEGGTAYVSLEPHCHQGRTEPCTEALAKAGIVRVVAPIEDPNPLVSGRGFEVLRKKGIRVETGILKKEAEKQNEKFIHWHKTGRPFVHLKIASSLDGRVATRTGDSKWITGEESRKKVHDLRHEYDAILVGSNTALIDNPLLTDRSGKTRRRELVRVVLDNSLRLNVNSQLVLTANEFPTIVFSDCQDEEKLTALKNKGVEVIDVAQGGRNLRAVLGELGERQLQSVFVEGGAEVAGSFCDSGLVDKISFFVAPMVIGGRGAPSAIGGVGAQLISGAIRLRDVETSKWGKDMEVSGYPE